MTFFLTVSQPNVLCQVVTLYGQAEWFFFMIHLNASTFMYADIQFTIQYIGILCRLSRFERSVNLLSSQKISYIIWPWYICFWNKVARRSFEIALHHILHWPNLLFKLNNHSLRCNEAIKCQVSLLEQEWSITGNTSWIYSWRKVNLLLLFFFLNLSCCFCLSYPHG